MTEDAEYSPDLTYGAGVQNRSSIYGTEYRYPLQGMHKGNVPCAVCVSTRQDLVMIPGKASCPEKWTREYFGYLMAAYYTRDRSM